MITLAFRDFDAFIYGCHVLGENSTGGVEIRGGNVLEVPEAGWEALTDEQRGEITRFLVGVTPPGDAEGGAAAPEVGRRPVAPQSLSPLPYPPETGPGSGRGVWQRYVIAQGLEYDPADTRDQLIARVKAERPDVVPVVADPAADEADAPAAPPPEAPPDASHPDAPPVMTDQPAPGTE